MWRQGHDLIIDFKFAGLWVLLHSSTSNKSIFQQELLIDWQNEIPLTAYQFCIPPSYSENVLLHCVHNTLFNDYYADINFNLS